MMKRSIILILAMAAMCLSDVEEVEKFSARKGKLTVRSTQSDRTPEGSSAPGAKGTWDYDDDYLYIWIDENTVMRVALESFGASRIRAVETGFPIKTVAGEDLRTVEDY